MHIDFFSVVGGARRESLYYVFDLYVKQISGISKTGEDILLLMPGQSKTIEGISNLEKKEFPSPKLRRCGHCLGVFW